MTFDAKKMREANAFYQKALTDALGQHDDAVQSSDAPEGVKNALLGLDVSSIKGGAKTFCTDWAEAGAEIKSYSRWPFVGKYVAKIYALWQTADKFIVHDACAAVASVSGAEEAAQSAGTAEPKLKKNWE
jgi:hypothetical protein